MRLGWVEVGLDFNGFNLAGVVRGFCRPGLAGVKYGDGAAENLVQQVLAFAGREVDHLHAVEGKGEAQSAAFAFGIDEMHARQ